MSRSKKMDNLARDSIAMKALGYGCHYGAYKTDYPNTKDNQEIKPEFKTGRGRSLYQGLCEVCGKVFFGKHPTKKTCSDACKAVRDKELQKAKKEAKQNAKKTG